MIGRASVLALVSAVCAAGATVIDRIAVVVERQAIKLSEIDRDLRVTEFLNREPLDLGPQARKKAAERLIDQVAIRNAVTANGFPGPSEKDADVLLADLQHDRFGGSAELLRQGLSQYGLTEKQLLEHLLWQLQVLRFIDGRFRPGVQVSDQEIRDYYTQHRAQLERENPGAAGFDALAPKIRATLEGEKIDKSFFQWLDQARGRSRIEFKQEAFE
jgi:hypothetical protein